MSTIPIGELMLQVDVWKRRVESGTLRTFNFREDEGWTAKTRGKQQRGHSPIILPLDASNTLQKSQRGLIIIFLRDTGMCGLRQDM